MLRSKDEQAGEAVGALAALVGIAVGLVISRLTEVQCPRAFGNCWEAHRFSTTESVGIGLLAAVAVVLGVTVLSNVRNGRSG